jgi:3-hydroxyacyl-CoA dehydrogenase
MVSIHHQPLNATARVVSVGLLPAIEDPNRQTDHAAAVLFGVGSSLMADADIREFGQRNLSGHRRRRHVGFGARP